MKHRYVTLFKQNTSIVNSILPVLVLVGKTQDNLIHHSCENTPHDISVNCPLILFKNLHRF